LFRAGLIYELRKNFNTNTRRANNDKIEEIFCSDAELNEILEEIKDINGYETDQEQRPGAFAVTSSESWSHQGALSATVAELKRSFHSLSATSPILAPQGSSTPNPTASRDLMSTKQDTAHSSHQFTSPLPEPVHKSKPNTRSQSANMQKGHNMFYSGGIQRSPPTQRATYTPLERTPNASPEPTLPHFQAFYKQEHPDD